MENYEKAYKEALEAMKDCEPDKNGYVTVRPCDIFTELKESEDEKIRKGIIKFLIDANNGAYTKSELEIASWIAWLEKQGEQKQTMAIPKWKYKKDSTPLLQDSIILNKYGCVAKSPSGAIVSDVWILNYNELAKLPKEKLEQESTDKVEPKLKVGDWIACEELKTALIVNIDDDRYEVEFIDGNKGFPHIDYIDRLFHLWTIADAKDGDVLVTVDDKYPFIYKGCLDPNHPDAPVAYCGIDDKGYFCKGGDNFDHWWTDVKVQPATKEQSNILFQKMKEAHYEWDNEKKELKRIEQVDGFDAELNALLKKYEHLPKEQLLECMNFYVDELEKQWRDEI